MIQRELSFLSLGLSYQKLVRIQVTGILNHTNSNLGIGNEGILSMIYQFSNDGGKIWTSGFILFAQVSPVYTKKFCMMV